SSHPVHPTLHSFPTRRSSDLFLRSTRKNRDWNPAFGRVRNSRRQLIAARPNSRALSRSLPAATRESAARWPCSLPGKAPTSPSRSEEHTSELQSRENLVCRLL